ncbi:MULTISPECIES: FMN-binding protein [unclassified Mesotoga]|jgi:uncharacterized protein with FMN-binding domain|uniref:FMN-binding protein n=1 Tax=unclassified Mesotoga TaxID=1184398 RepID=UPI001BD1E96F|nr:MULTISPECIES: FMN-binding protein [unclassified Mesotoga]MDD3459666.1 FMN-binding protein [Mesotoga sp.]
MKYTISVSIFLALAMVIIGVVFNWQVNRPEKIPQINLQPFGNLEDGVYVGREGYVGLEVEILDGRIIEIRIVQNRSDRYARSAEALTERIIEAQSLDVDVITGATATSESIVAAVKAAIGGIED